MRANMVPQRIRPSRDSRNHGIRRDGPMSLARLWSDQDSRRGRMRKLRNVGIWFMLILTFFAGLVIIRPPFWRNILFEGMFGACRDRSIAGARVWMLLGASPDGESDCEAGNGYNGFEFSSHVHTAVDNNDSRLLRLLLARGASPDLRLGDGSSPIMSAVHDHSVETLMILLDAGANPRYSDRWTAVDQARALGFSDLVPLIEPYLHREQIR